MIASRSHPLNLMDLSIGQRCVVVVDERTALGNRDGPPLFYGSTWSAPLFRLLRGVVILAEHVQHHTMSAHA